MKGGSIKTKHCYEEYVADALNIRIPRGLKIFQEFQEYFRLSKILSRFGLWTTYRLDPISLAVGIKRSHWKHSESQSLQSVPCSVTAVSPYSYLIQTITSLAFFLSSLLKKFPVQFCSILHYSLYITLPFLWCHPAFLLSGSHFPSCSCSSPTPDRTVLCDVRIGRIGSDYFCTRQDKNTHNAHLSAEHVDWACSGLRPRVLQIALPSSWGIVFLIFSTMKWNLCHTKSGHDVCKHILRDILNCCGIT